MLLDFRKIFASYDAPVVHTAAFDLSQESFPGYTVENPVTVEFTATKEGAAIRLSVHITATVLAECARCLDPVCRDFAVNRVFFIRDEEWALDDPEGNNLPFTQDGKLDVKELAYTELMLEIPTVLLCSEDCAGLCPVCGHRQPCSCRCETSDKTDARLLILKQLLTD